jgi:hypothetical protein
MTPDTLDPIRSIAVAVVLGFTLFVLGWGLATLLFIKK